MSKTTKPLKLFFFIDALGWEFVQHSGFLKDIAPNRSKLETVFGYSSTCDPTILTGKIPSEHKHFSFFTYAKNSKLSHLSPLGILPNYISGRHKFRRLFNIVLPKILKWDGYFNLYSVPFKYMKYLDYTEKRNIFRPGGIIGGQKNLHEVWTEQEKKFFIHDWKKSHLKNLQTLRELIKNKQIETSYFINFELDATMHMHGVKNEKSLQCAQSIASEISETIKLAKEYYSSVKFYVFGDHGMADCKNAIPLLKDFEKLKLKYGKDYVAVWDSTMARFWFFNNKSRETALNFLKTQDSGALVSDDTLKKWGCYFDDHRYGEHFFVMHPGNLLVPSFMGLKFIKGMHGYSPEDKDSWTSWLSNDGETPAPKSITEIFNVLTKT